jgi:PAS domain S-box-containing protein
MATADPERQPELSKLERLERKERSLLGLCLLLLTMLAVGFAFVGWQGLRQVPLRLEALPIGAVVLVVLFAAYIWNKKREIAELRGFIHGLQRSAGGPPSEQQLQHLVEIISRSQRDCRDLIDSLEHIVLAVSLTGEVLVVNRHFADLLGLPFVQIVGRPLDEFLLEPSRAAVEPALPRFLENRLWSGLVRARLKKDDRMRYFDCLLRAMVKSDCVTGISVLARDVTEQREAELRFTELFETLQEGAYFSTPDGQVLDVNPALVRMLGFGSKEEMLAISAFSFYADPAQRRALMRELEEKGTIREREITLRRKDGALILCLDTAAATRDGSGRIVRYQGTLVDITEKREMERRLHEEREFARRLVASFPDVIVVLDAAGRCTYVSGRAKDLLGYEPGELMGQTLGERADPNDRPALLELFGDLLAGRRQIGDIEYRTQHKGGSWRTFRTAASPLFDAEGKIVGVIAAARDVTTLKRLEQQLIQSEKLAAVGQMIAGVAHELNNPLTVILATCELLRDQPPEEARRRHVEVVHEQARRAARIVEGLLVFSRPSALSRARVNLSELLQHALQLQQQSLRANGIGVDLVPEAALPPVIGDPNRLVQVFLNIITNSEQAIRAVRDQGTIRIRFGQSGENVWVSFQDDGGGIPPEILPKIFDPFFTTKRPGRGTGLGLSICLAIAREHGGNIEVQSSPESGSVFTVLLPVAGVGQSPANQPVGSEALAR